MALLVVKPGPLLTVQDNGRPGWGRFGVSPSGALDPLAARAAHALVGNPADAACLEVTGAGAELQFQDACLIALAGADLGAEICGVSNRRLAAFTAAPVAAGDRLRFTSRRRGARAYLAVQGGLAVAPASRMFGSAATDLAAGLGPAPLRAGERLAAGNLPTVAAATGARTLGQWYEPADRLRFVPAPGATAAALAGLAAAPYTVTPRSNRAGYLLDGPPLPSADPGPEPLSEPIPPGTLQVPPDGRPILLMADRQTIGGYPAIGYLARVDLPKAAQLWPGDRIHFVATALEEAQRALRAQQAALAAWSP
jgi:biotin-dependent carboxylase-like uncharacterized protein